MRKHNKQKFKNGVSVITCTNKSRFLNNLFKNFLNQLERRKELIIIVNRDHISLAPYRKKAKYLSNVTICRLPEKTSLGNCLNYGISKARYKFIAKFDDDDFYAPNYLRRSMRILKGKNLDVVWKSSVFVYLESRNCLYIRYPNRRDRLAGFVAGGTIMFKRNVYPRVKFANVSLGEDARFLKTCRAMGYKINSTDRFNYVYIRRKNRKSHSMKVRDRYWLKHSRLVRRTRFFKKLVTR
ncbi:glycosyltransferase [Paenibacillus cremeus]|uniref:glycosyltransferase n=1 Tax=Paenibacillus cremeus TaxID=2163881 RepID=UPI0016445EC3|nr:glycosyltransferase [Paenibacillus cremeus]